MIAIHERTGSFSDNWVRYCEENHIPYKVVNCYDNDIMEQLKDCKALMWHFDHLNYKDTLISKQLILAFEQAGLKTFPNSRTSWHFDDKIAQKYLLESIDAPLVRSYVFFDRRTAINWAKTCDYPKVFKLRGGAGGSNVRLVESYKRNLKLISKAFSCGFSRYNSIHALTESTRFANRRSGSMNKMLKSAARVIVPSVNVAMANREKGYVYYQDFIPNNESDTRVIVIGDKAYGMQRLVRKNDFRASGSDNFTYDAINEDTLKIAFETSSKLRLQSVAFDFIYSPSGQPLIVEMSYVYGTKGSSRCPGYWDRDLRFHRGEFDPTGWMVEQLL